MVGRTALHDSPGTPTTKESLAWFRAQRDQWSQTQRHRVQPLPSRCRTKRPIPSPLQPRNLGQPPGEASDKNEEKQESSSRSLAILTNLPQNQAPDDTKLSFAWPSWQATSSCSQRSLTTTTSGNMIKTDDGLGATFRREGCSMVALTSNDLLSRTEDSDKEKMNDDDESFRRRLIEFYTRYNPSKLSTIDETLVKFKGRYQELFAKLEAKYHTSSTPGAAEPTHRISGKGPLVYLQLDYYDSDGGQQPPTRSPRIVIQLFADLVPRTAENFRCLCTGEKGLGRAGKPLSLRNTVIHRIVPNFCLQGGDLTRGDGTGGESIYPPNLPGWTDLWGNFRDERKDLRHAQAGLLSTANNGPDRNSSQFFITLRPSLTSLNGKHVVFGEIMDPKVVSFLQKLAYKLPTDDKQRPLKPLIIVDCGEIEPGSLEASAVLQTHQHLTLETSADSTRDGMANDSASATSIKNTTDTDTFLYAEVGMTGPAPTSTASKVGVGVLSTPDALKQQVGEEVSIGRLDLESSAAFPFPFTKDQAGTVCDTRSSARESAIQPFKEQSTDDRGGSNENHLLFAEAGGSASTILAGGATETAMNLKSNIELDALGSKTDVERQPNQDAAKFVDPRQADIEPITATPSVGVEHFKANTHVDQSSPRQEVASLPTYELSEPKSRAKEKGLRTMDGEDADRSESDVGEMVSTIAKRWDGPSEALTNLEETGHVGSAALPSGTIDKVPQQLSTEKKQSDDKLFENASKVEVPSKSAYQQDVPQKHQNGGTALDNENEGTPRARREESEMPHSALISKQNTSLIMRTSDPTDGDIEGSTATPTVDDEPFKANSDGDESSPLLEVATGSLPCHESSETDFRSKGKGPRLKDGEDADRSEFDVEECGGAITTTYECAVPLEARTKLEGSGHGNRVATANVKIEVPQALTIEEKQNEDQVFENASVAEVLSKSLYQRDHPPDHGTVVDCDNEGPPCARTGESVLSYSALISNQNLVSLHASDGQILEEFHTGTNTDSDQSRRECAISVLPIDQTFLVSSLGILYYDPLVVPLLLYSGE